MIRMKVGISSQKLTLATITIAPTNVKDITITSNIVNGSLLSMIPISMENLD